MRCLLHGYLIAFVGICHVLSNLLTQRYEPFLAHFLLLACHFLFTASLVLTPDGPVAFHSTFWSRILFYVEALACPIHDCRMTDGVTHAIIDNSVIGLVLLHSSPPVCLYLPLQRYGILRRIHFACIRASVDVPGCRHLHLPVCLPFPHGTA